MFSCLASDIEHQSIWHRAFLVLDVSKTLHILQREKISSIIEITKISIYLYQSLTICGSEGF